MDGIKKRKARFWAMLTAFVLLFTYLGPAAVMAKSQSVTSEKDLEAADMSFIEPGEKISWGGDYKVTKVHYLDRDPNFYVKRNYENNELLAVNGENYTNFLATVTTDADDKTKSHTVKTYSDAGGTYLSSDEFSGWRGYFVKDVDCAGNKQVIVMLVALGYATATLETGEGKVSSNEITIPEGEQLYLPTPEWKGHVFDHWARKDRLAIADDHAVTTEPAYHYSYEPGMFDNYHLSEDTTFTAFYKINAEFDTKGGTPVPATQYLGIDCREEGVILVRDTLHMPRQNPTKKGYSFDGWKTPEGQILKTEEAFNGYGEESIEKDTVFTAVWVPDKHTVTYKVFLGGKWSEWKKFEKVDYGTVLERPADPELDPTISENRVFDGWYLDEACTQAYDFSKPLEGDLVLYGQFTEPKPEEETLDGPVKFDPSGTLIQAAVVKRTSNSLTVQWNKFTGADGYFVYAKICYKKPLKKVADIANGSALQYEHTGLKTGKCYKFIVRPYKLVGGKKKKIGKSMLIHACTLSSRYTVAKGVDIQVKKGPEMKKTASGNSITVEKGKTVKFKASEIREEEGKHIPKGHRNVKGNVIFQSNDSSIATITGRGKLEAKKAGKCTIYGVALNGFLSSVEVTVVE